MMCTRPPRARRQSTTRGSRTSTRDSERDADDPASADAAESPARGSCALRKPASQQRMRSASSLWPAAQEARGRCSASDVVGRRLSRSSDRRNVRRSSAAELRGDMIQ
eukprot:1496797-Prymnesium_polylepis.1